MKITKKMEAEILHVMEEYWSSYFNGNLQTWASYLPDDYKNIGTTKTEIWDNKKEIVDFTEKVIDQTVGMAEVRNKKTQIIPYSPYVMVHELGDAYVKAEEGWIFYAQFRLSSLLEKTADGWKVLHQHGSYPDSKADEGEAFGFDELRAENKKLRDAIQARTIELENKNRELEIEAALERVRAQTMAMHNSEDVGKCTVKMFSEVTALGVDEGTRFGIGILNHDNDDNQLWTASKDGEEVKMLIGKIDMTSHPLLKSARKAWEEKASLHRYILEGEDLRNYYQVLNNAPDYKYQTAIEKLPEREFHYGFVFDHGFFYAFSLREFPPELIRIVQRFSSLFGQTYRRYLDLVKAEAQAREAQIEAALERVRSASMAMHKTEELATVATTLFNQFQVLEVDILLAFMGIYHIEESYVHQWFSPIKGIREESFFIRLPSAPWEETTIKDWKAGKEMSFESTHGAAAVLQYAKEIDAIAELDLFENMVKKLSIDTIEQTEANHKYGNLSIVQQRKATSAEIAILKRFAKVFEQTYTRFLDLQKAEAQAGEAQIEAALERVRARSMAMHKSEELEEVIKVLYDQFVQLNIFIEHTGFIIDYKNRDDMLIWLADENAIQPQVTIPYFDSPHWNSFIEAKEKGKNFFANHLNFEEKNNFYKKLFTYIPDLPEDVKAHYFSCPGLAISTVLMDNVGLYIENFSGIPYSGEDNAILMRFGRVFQQTYTRFLDLQKAEAQTREAKIEAALERIRAQSMMMQHSDELNTTSNVFHEQLLQLGLPSEFSYVWLPDEANMTHLFWATWSEKNASRSKAYTYPLDKSEPYTAACFEMWESDEDVFVNPIKPEEVEGFFSTWSELVGEAEQLKAKNFPDGLYYAEAYMKYGCFGINIRRPLDGTEQEVLRRFANEFERTYTRFLDLQKAEEQAQKIKLVNQENERLLHSILPQPIAEQIRTGRHNVVKRFEQVSILFADIVGFTILSEKVSPQKVVDILNGLFSKFDDLTDKYNLEKIKTIGDAYMVAAGVPEERAGHAKILFLFAQDMLRSLEEYNSVNNSELNIRIGISSGPVVAGVIGKKKFAYDLWGDSVNTAARMEAYGREGKIQVSPASYDLLKNDFAFEKMPGVNIKGKGVMDVYLWRP